MAGQVEASPAVLAAEVAELVRSLNYATAPWGSRLDYPGDVYEVLGALKVTAERLPQLCGQLARFLDVELCAGRILAVQGQPYAGDPVAAVSAAGLALADAGADAWALAGELARAQQAIAGLAHNDVDDRAAGCADCSRPATHRLDIHGEVTAHCDEHAAAGRERGWEPELLPGEDR